MASTNGRLAYLVKAARGAFPFHRDDFRVLRMIEHLCAIPTSYECVVSLAFHQDESLYKHILAYPA